MLQPAHLPKSPLVLKKTSQSEWHAEFYSYLPFIQVSFWGRSCLIYHVLWKLFHGKQKCDLRGVPMTVFICYEQPRDWPKTVGMGLEGSKALTVHKPWRQKEIAHQIWIIAKLRNKGDLSFSSGWELNVAGFRHTAHGCGGLGTSRWCSDWQSGMWLFGSGEELKLEVQSHLVFVAIRNTGWQNTQSENRAEAGVLRAIALGGREEKVCKKEVQGKEIQIVGGMPECHRRQILSLTLVMPPPLFFPWEVALCVWTPRPCLSRWVWPSGNSCRRWGRRGGCSICSTSPHSWSLCAGGELGWRHNLHQVPLLTCLCLSGSQELCVPSLQPRRAEVKA